VKNNLGRTLLVLLAFVLLQAEDFTYKMTVDKNNPFVKEGIILTFDIQQTNKEVVLMFNFDLKQSDNYTFQRLDSKETDSYHNVQIRYEYLIYPLKAGKVDIAFELLKKITTDHSIAFSIAGDRDHVEGIETTDTKIDLPSVAIEVKPLPEGTRLVGDFTLAHHLKNKRVKPHEPLPLQVTIKGEGYPPVLDSILPHTGVFKRFTEPPLVKSLSTLNGTQNSVHYPMALSHDKSFTLPPIDIKAFNPKTEKSYMLSIPSQHFEIQTVNTDVLLDDVDVPEPFNIDFSWITTLLSYLIVFGAGYLSAIAFKWKRKQIQTSLPPLHHKIQKVVDEKQLLQLLMATDDKRFAPTIKKLESSLYGDDKINLNKIKQEAQGLL